MASNPFEQLADAHRQAWQELAESASGVVALPLRTLQHLVGLKPIGEPVPSDTRDGRIADLEADVQLERARLASLSETLERTRRDAAVLVEELRRTYAVLEREIDVRADQARDDQKRSLYGRLEPLLTQLPVVRQAIERGLPVEARDVVDLLAPLDDALTALGFLAIGQVGEDVGFDTAWQQMASGAPPEAGQLVTVKNVGYQLDGRLLRKARVSRKKPE